MKNSCITQAKRKKDKNSKVENVSVVLLYDKEFIKIKSCTSTPLLSLGRNIRIIDYHINFANRNFKNPEIVVCLGQDSVSVIEYLQQRYKNKPVRVVENINYNQTNTCEGLRISLNNVVNDNVFVISSLTIPVNISFKQNNSTKIYLKNEESKQEIGANINEKNKVELMSFAAKNSWYEMMWITDKKSLSVMRKLLLTNNYKKRCWFELINDMIEKKVKIDYEYLDDNCLKIKKPKDYKTLNGEIQ